MVWMIRSGYLCLTVGIALAATAVLIPGCRQPLVFPGIVLAAIGLIDIVIGRYLAKLFGWIPKMGGFGEMAETMSSAALMLNQQTRSDRLRANGLDAKAEVLAMRDTGQVFNFDPILEFDLRVYRGANMPYKVESYRQLVSKIMISKISVGATYAARVDPQDPNCLYLSWN